MKRRGRCNRFYWQTGAGIPEMLPNYGFGESYASVMRWKRLT
jgi:hypothetical protein